MLNRSSLKITFLFLDRPVPVRSNPSLSLLRSKASSVFLIYDRSIAFQDVLKHFKCLYKGHPKNLFLQVILVRPSKWQNLASSCKLKFNLARSCQILQVILARSCLNDQLARTCKILQVTRSSKITCKNRFLGCILVRGLILFYFRVKFITSGLKFIASGV